MKQVVTIIYATFLAQASQAFDAGYHIDLTRQGLSAAGYGTDAINCVCVANWAVDYYSYSGTARNIQDNLRKLHFDNLYSRAQADYYWHQFLKNVEAGVKETVRRDSQHEFLTTLGATLHAVQDFYAHSNWSEQHPRANDQTYRSATWYTAGIPAGMNIVTGKYRPYPTIPPPGAPQHGGYKSGLNKDSHIRPLWDEAYVFAYVATSQTIATVHRWCDEVDPGFIQKAKTLTLTDEQRNQIESDRRAAYEVSLWVKDKSKGIDGHWKGNFSGDRTLFLKAWNRFGNSPDSIIIATLKQGAIPQRLARNLYQGPVTDSPAIEAVDLDFRVVVVGVTHISEVLSPFGLRIDNASEPDFFCQTTIGDFTFVERTVQDDGSVENPWLSLAFVPVSKLPTSVRISVWDEEDFGRDPELCDIHPANNKRELNLTVDASVTLSGDATGRFSSPANAMEMNGNGDENLAKIRLYVAVLGIE